MKTFKKEKEDTSFVKLSTQWKNSFLLGLELKSCKWLIALHELKIKIKLGKDKKHFGMVLFYS